MSTDAEQRIARAVRALADAVPVVPPDSADLLARATAPGTRRTAPDRWAPGRAWLQPLVAAAAVLLVLVAAAVVPGLVPEHRPTGPAGGLVLPARPAPLSLLTAPVSDSPPGPVGLSYVVGNSGPRSLHTSQTIVVGVDGRTYRRVDLAERRGRPVEMGTWQDAAVLLSPDGTRLAAGSEHEVDTLPVQDLRTGRIRDYRLPQRGAVEALAFAPDGNRLAYGVRPATLFGSGPEPVAAAEVGILDLDTGAVTPVGGTASALAFSPDGTRVAVQGDYDAPEPLHRAVRLVDLATGSVGQLPDVGYAVRLAGAAAWSPDGRLLAVVNDAGAGKLVSTVGLLPVQQPGARTTWIETPGSDIQVLGWRSADRILITRDPDDGAGQPVYEAGLDGDLRQVMQLREGWLSPGHSYGWRVATALLPEATYDPASAVARGPWPRWWWLTLTVGALLGLAVVYLVVRRRRTGLSWPGRRRRRLPSPP